MASTPIEVPMMNRPPIHHRITSSAPQLQRLRDGPVERLRSLEIDDEIEFDWLQHRQVAGFASGLRRRLFDYALVAQVDVGELGVGVFKVEFDGTGRPRPTAADFGDEVFE